MAWRIFSELHAHNALASENTCGAKHPVFQEIPSKKGLFCAAGIDRLAR
jgi:hypothetical protein